MKTMEIRTQIQDFCLEMMNGQRYTADARLGAANLLFELMRLPVVEGGPEDVNSVKQRNENTAEHSSIQIPEGKQAAPPLNEQENVKACVQEVGKIGPIRPNAFDNSASRKELFDALYRPQSSQETLVRSPFAPDGLAAQDSTQLPGMLKFREQTEQASTKTTQETPPAAKISSGAAEAIRTISELLDRPGWKAGVYNLDLSEPEVHLAWCPGFLMLYGWINKQFFTWSQEVIKTITPKIAATYKRVQELDSKPRPGVLQSVIGPAPAAQPLAPMKTEPYVDHFRWWNPFTWY